MSTTTDAHDPDIEAAIAAAMAHAEESLDDGEDE